MEMSKQQPLTPCEYIVLPFGIVYIRSVSVVATRPLSIFKFCENLIVRTSFNNALRFLMFDNLSEVTCKFIEKTVNLVAKTKNIFWFQLNNCILNERLVCTRPTCFFLQSFWKAQVESHIVSRISDVATSHSSDNGYFSLLLDVNNRSTNVQMSK